MKRFLIASVLLFSVVTALAQDSTKKESPWYESITMNVLGEASWIGNLNKPASHQNQLRIFDTQSNSFAMDAFELTIKRDAASGDAGFRADLVAGTGLPKVMRASGFNIGDLDFRQLYFSYVVPIGHGLQIDAGKFASPHGYEVIDAFDGYNDNASRSFQFGYAVPFTHTGVRFTYSLGSVVTVAAMVTNGWDNAIDNNDAKTVHGQISLTPGSGVSVLISGAHGAEQTNNNSNMRSLLDVVASWAISERFSIGTCIDMASEQAAGLAGEDASWKGITGYARLGLCDKFALCARAEVFDDPNGARTKTAQTLRSFTLTPEYKPSSHFILRGDLRLDQSTVAVFDKDGALVTSQPTVSINGVVVF